MLVPWAVGSASSTNLRLIQSLSVSGRCLTRLKGLSRSCRAKLVQTCASASSQTENQSARTTFLLSPLQRRFESSRSQEPERTAGCCRLLSERRLWLRPSLLAAARWRLWALFHRLHLWLAAQWFWVEKCRRSHRRWAATRGRANRLRISHRMRSAGRLIPRRRVIQSSCHTVTDWLAAHCSVRDLTQKTTTN
ncbi:tail tip assembly protein I [Klebsiella phage vB_KshKPC-M]|nr:tail tip assembly protein I [Klebsiella phage vB_KshKPC-M]